VVLVHRVMVLVHISAVSWLLLDLSDGMDNQEDIWPPVVWS